MRTTLHVPHARLTGLLTLTLLSTRAAAQIAGCPGSLPPGLAALEELRHDDGTSAQYTVGAGGPGGVQREIHHGNRFVGNGETITHVCVYAEDAGETIEIYFSTGDDTTYGDVRPNVPGITHTAVIQGGYQLIDINPPAVASGVFWIVAAFPHATPGDGHVGVTNAQSPGVHGESFVGVMPGAPGGLATWTDYEDVPAAALYNGVRPLIRGLHIGLPPGCGNAGVTVSTLGSLQTSEQGGTAQLNVALTGPMPTHNVLALISSSDTSEGTVNPSVLIFTPGNYMTPQPVTVTGQDDLAQDGDVSYTIGILLSSLDNCYHGLTALPVPVVNVDDDGPVQPNGVCCMGTVCDPTLLPADCAANGGAWQIQSSICMYCCPGDANGDGFVDVDDIIAVLLSFHSTGAPGIPGDVDLDGDVDVDDLIEVILNFGTTC